MEAYQKKHTQLMRKKERELQAQFRKKESYYDLALAGLGIYSFVMTMIYLY